VVATAPSPALPSSSSNFNPVDSNNQATQENKFQLTLKSGKDLPAASGHFVEFSLGSQFFRSEAAEGSHPDWEYSFLLDSPDNWNDALEVSIFTAASDSCESVCIGKVHVVMTTLLVKEGKEVWVKVLQSKKLVGRICLVFNTKPNLVAKKRDAAAAPKPKALKGKAGFSIQVAELAPMRENFHNPDVRESLSDYTSPLDASNWNPKLKLKNCAATPKKPAKQPLSLVVEIVDDTKLENVHNPVVNLESYASPFEVTQQWAQEKQLIKQGKLPPGSRVRSPSGLPMYDFVFSGLALHCPAQLGKRCTFVPNATDKVALCLECGRRV